MRQFSFARIKNVSTQVFYDIWVSSPALDAQLLWFIEHKF
jgi:hypothetical protein